MLKAAKIKWYLLGFLSYNFANFQDSAWLLLWKKGKVWNNFCLYSSVTELQNPPRYISGCFKAPSCDWGWHLLRTCSWCVLCWSRSCFQFTHIQTNLLRQAAPSDQSLHTYVHIVWSSLEQAFSLELNPATHPDSCPFTVVCSSLCCRT